MKIVKIEEERKVKQTYGNKFTENINEKLQKILDEDIRVMASGASRPSILININ